MAGFGGALPGGIGEMAKSLGLDNLDDLDKAMAPAPAPDARTLRDVLKRPQPGDVFAEKLAQGRHQFL